MEGIKEVLIRRDGLTEEAADDLIQEAKWQLADYIEEGDLTSAEEICAEYFGLEPDYLVELF